MIKINKQSPPIELLELKNAAIEKNLNADEAYRTLVNPLKSSVRQSLITEQGHLCAYCMRKIPDERVEDETNPGIYIEHWSARNAPDGSDAEGALDYNNMLVVCSGNQFDKTVKGKGRLTCDAKRGNRPLKVNPLDDTTLETIYYKNDGSISAEDKEIEDDLITKLNLNCSVDAVSLPKNRKETLKPIEEELGHYNDEEELIAHCKELLSAFEDESDPKTPYVGIIVWFLKDMLKHLNG